jgi:hypothetical protein
MAASPVFHIEMRQFPHTARRFNLSREEIHGRFLGAWLRGVVVELDSQQFQPGRAKISIYEGRRLETAELGIGRGWQNAVRTGADVTQRELEAARSALDAARSAAPPNPARARVADADADAAAAAAAVAAVKHELLDLCAVGPVAVSQALVLASGANPTARVSARLAIAEHAVGTLLQEGHVHLVRVGETEPVAAMDWGSLLLAWGTWAASPPSVMLVAAHRVG